MITLNKFDSVFNRYGVEFAVVYGSVYRGEDSEGSDIDIAVYLEGNTDTKEYMDRYISLIDTLNDTSDREVDITDMKTCRKSFAGRIARNCRVIYDPNNTADDKLDEYKSVHPDSKDLNEKTDELRDRVNSEI